MKLKPSSLLDALMAFLLLALLAFFAWNAANYFRWAQEREAARKAAAPAPRG